MNIHKTKIFSKMIFCSLSAVVLFQNCSRQQNMQQSDLASINQDEVPGESDLESRASLGLVPGDSSKNDPGASIFRYSWSKPTGVSWPGVKGNETDKIESIAKINHSFQLNNFNYNYDKKNEKILSCSIRQFCTGTAGGKCTSYNFLIEGSAEKTEKAKTTLYDFRVNISNMIITSLRRKLSTSLNFTKIDPGSYDNTKAESDLRGLKFSAAFLLLNPPKKPLGSKISAHRPAVVIDDFFIDKIDTEEKQYFINNIAKIEAIKNSRDSVLNACQDAVLNTLYGKVDKSEASKDTCILSIDDINDNDAKDLNNLTIDNKVEGVVYGNQASNRMIDSSAAEESLSVNSKFYASISSLTKFQCQNKCTNFLAGIKFNGKPIPESFGYRCYFGDYSTDERASAILLRDPRVLKTCKFLINNENSTDRGTQTNAGCERSVALDIAWLFANENLATVMWGGQELTFTNDEEK